MKTLSRRSFIAGAVSAPLVAQSAAYGLAFYPLFDASGSMFAPPNASDVYSHIHIQRDGHIAAFQDPAVRVALIENRAYVEPIVWHEEARSMFGGIAIRSQRDLDELCERISADDHVKGSSIAGRDTVHGVGVAFVLGLPHRADTVIIDISTDQAKVQDDVCPRLRRLAHERGVRINGLAIRATNEDLSVMERNLITRDGFCLRIGSWQEYPEAIRQKFLQELIA